MVQLSCSEWWPCLLYRGVSAILWYRHVSDVWLWRQRQWRCNTWIFACKIFCLWLFWIQVAQLNEMTVSKSRFFVCTFFNCTPSEHGQTSRTCLPLIFWHVQHESWRQGRHRAAQSINCGQCPHCAINVSPLWRNVTCPACAVPSRAAHYTRSRVQTESEWAGMLSVVTKTTLLRTSKHFSTRLVAVTGPLATVPHQYSNFLMAP